MKPFTLNIENDVLEGISYRLKSSRLTEDIGNSNWNYGTERNYLEELLEYWISEYDWKKTEDEINSLPNFICEINDVLKEISYRLKSSRLTQDIGNSNWNYGTERNYLE